MGFVAGVAPGVLGAGVECIVFTAGVLRPVLYELASHLVLPHSAGPFCLVSHWSAYTVKPNVRDIIDRDSSLYCCGYVVTNVGVIEYRMTKATGV